MKGENLFNSAHKASNEKSRAGWDRTFKSAMFTMKDLDKKYKPEELVGTIEGVSPSPFMGAPHKYDEELNKRIQETIEDHKEEDVKSKETTKLISESKGD